MRCQKNFAIILVILLVILILPASATITPVTSMYDTIVKGDKVTFIGSEAMNGTVSIWVLGRDYFAVKMVQPDKLGNFTFVIKPEETRTYSSGEYAFFIVDPGSDNAFQIEPLIRDEGIKIADRGKFVADIGKKEDLPAIIRPKADIITKTANLLGVDDIITPYFFYIESPSMHFDGLVGSDSQSRLPNHTTGEKIEISGTTNMGIENQLHVEIHDLTSRSLVISGNVPVVDGAYRNRWSYTLAAPGLPTGDYYISVGRLSGISSETGTVLLTVDEHNSLPTERPGEFAGPGQDLGILVPIFISIGALGIIGILIISSMRS